MLTIGSVFSGVGGIDLGLQMAGHGPIIWQIEIDDYCRMVLKKHWPDAVRYEDVTRIKEQELEYVDIICGGSPCQDLSMANCSGDGLAGPRSSLWFDMLRIIRDVGPRWVVFENVGHAGGRWVDAVRFGLANAGYESLPIPIEARFFGAPHRRSRILVVAHALGEQLREQPRGGRRARGKGASQPAEHGSHEGWPARLHVAAPPDGAPQEMVRALGNLCMPQMAQIAGEVINLLMEKERLDAR